MTTLTMVGSRPTDTIASFPISTRDLHRMLRTVMPHRHDGHWYSRGAGGTGNIQIEIDPAEDRWPMLTMTATDGYTLAASCAALNGSDTPRADWTALVSGDSAAELLQELRLPGLQNKVAAATVTAAGLTLVLPDPGPRVKRPWRTTWHLPAADGDKVDWRTKVAEAFAALADDAPVAGPIGISLLKAQKWAVFVEDYAEPIVLLAGPDKPMIVFADGAIGLHRPLRFSNRENVAASYLANAWWALPNAEQAAACAWAEGS